jgi:hypothetical protein
MNKKNISEMKLILGLNVKFISHIIQLLCIKPYSFRLNKSVKNNDGLFYNGIWRNLIYSDSLSRFWGTFLVTFYR